MRRLLARRQSRHLVLILVDLLCLSAAAALIFGLYPSIEVRLTTEEAFVHAITLVLSIFLFRFAFRVYSQSWRFANEAVYLLFIMADVLGGLFYYVLSPRLVYRRSSAIHALAVVAIELLFTLFTRFLYQYRRTRERKIAVSPGKSKSGGHSSKPKARIAIVGASVMGVQLASELLEDKDARYQPVCFFDNNPEKIGNYILGLKVHPESDQVPVVTQQLGIDTFVIAIPDKDAHFLRNLFEFYKQFNKKVLIYDYPANRLLQGGQSKLIREINIEDLLPRDKVLSLGENKADFYKDEVILVSGAGGSIGGELCRQLYEMEPRQLILLDINENGVYDLYNELVQSPRPTQVVIEIASVRDQQRVAEMMMHYQPAYVFHAAAHKHVPLMEHNPQEAVKNNVFGTLNMVDAAERSGVKRFVMVSTDKAVNPTNVMGATKRICEMIIQSRKDSKTDFVAVRFGNVLNSNGSVVPLFMQQIAKGGPVTLTDKRVVRYFMMIPEAAQLVLQTGCRAEKGDVYVLNMGQQVRILDLAENLIRLNGLEPYRDVDIVEIGLRPGEKLYEEILVKGELMRQTEDQNIYIEHESGPTREQVEAKLALLAQALAEEDATAMRAALQQAVPTYQDMETVNQQAIMEARLERLAN